MKLSSRLLFFRKTMSRASFWYTIYHISSKFEIWPFWDFWPQVTFNNLETPSNGKLTLWASFRYTIYPLFWCSKFDLRWPQICNLSQNSVFFRLEIIFKFYWSFERLFAKIDYLFDLQKINKSKPEIDHKTRSWTPAVKLRGRNLS